MSKATTPIAHAPDKLAAKILTRIPEPGLLILRNLIIEDLRPYMDTCTCPPKAKFLCRELEAVMFELKRRESSTLPVHPQVFSPPQDPPGDNPTPSP